MCKRNSPDLKENKKKKKRSQHGMYKRNSPQKNEVSKGCVSEIPEKEKKKKNKKKPTRDV